VDLYDLLACPHDRAHPLVRSDDAVTCSRCDRRYPIEHGVVVFLDAAELSEIERRERESRDEESTWYDRMFEGYTNAVEVPTAVRRIGHPVGPILDHGAGTGRITEALLRLGQPVVCVDYSAPSLRRLLERCGRGDSAVLALQCDVRRLPLRDGVFAAATSIEVYEHVRGRDNRAVMLEELERVLAAGAPLSISTFNYNAIFRAWRLLGNDGAKEGDHMLGGDFYYIRLTAAEFTEELEACFDVVELTGIRNIPARSIAGVLRRARLSGLADRFLGYMVERGHRVDFTIERTPLARALGFFWLAKVIRRESAIKA
jgi:SAM-dependent methyltransferase